MYLVGLTGGIASGKSTVASAWVELGGVEIDADELAREAVAPGTQGLAQVVSAFGEEIIKDGQLDRAALGSIVFADEIKLKQLEAIVHPIVKQLAKQRIEQLPTDSIVIYNVPLLVEAAVDLDFNKVVTVEAPTEKQIERLISNRNLNRQEAQARIGVQATPAQRANKADVILNSNQELKLLLKDARKLWIQIEREAAQYGSN